MNAYDAAQNAATVEAFLRNRGHIPRLGEGTADNPPRLPAMARTLCGLLETISLPAADDPHWQELTYLRAKIVVAGICTWFCATEADRLDQGNLVRDFALAYYVKVHGTMPTRDAMAALTRTLRRRRQGSLVGANGAEELAIALRIFAEHALIMTHSPTERTEEARNLPGEHASTFRGLADAIGHAPDQATRQSEYGMLLMCLGHILANHGGDELVRVGVLRFRLLAEPTVLGEEVDTENN